MRIDVLGHVTGWGRDLDLQTARARERCYSSAIMTLTARSTCQYACMGHDGNVDLHGLSLTYALV